MFQPGKYTHIVIGSFIWNWIMSAIFGVVPKSLCGRRLTDPPSVEGPNERMCPRCVGRYIISIGESVDSPFINLNLPKNYRKALAEWDGR